MSTEGLGNVHINEPRLSESRESTAQGILVIIILPVTVATTTAYLLAFLYKILGASF